MLLVVRKNISSHVTHQVDSSSTKSGGFSHRGIYIGSPVRGEEGSAERACGPRPEKQNWPEKQKSFFENLKTGTAEECDPEGRAQHLLRIEKKMQLGLKAHTTSIGWCGRRLILKIWIVQFSLVAIRVIEKIMDGVDLSFYHHARQISSDSRVARITKVHHRVDQKRLDRGHSEPARLTVNWAYIEHGESGGTASSVDMKLREFMQLGIIEVPPPAAESPLTEPEPDKEEESSVLSVCAPTPLPAQRSRVWTGELQELDAGWQPILWDFLRFDPAGDVKMYDPKIVIVNQLGDGNHEAYVRRSNVLDLSDANVQDKRAYAVSCAIPGFEHVQRLPRLATWDPAKETDAFQFEVDDEHRLPAIGGPEALRILLVIEELKLEQPKILTRAEQRHVAVVKFLNGLHGTDPVVVEMRTHNKDNKQKHGKGPTPYGWASWLPQLLIIFKNNPRVPRCAKPELVQNTIVTKKHMAGLLQSSPDWASKCLMAAEVLALNRTHTELRRYLYRNDETDSIGIESFLKRVAAICDSSLEREQSADDSDNP
ncbi:hypothetical protein DFH08DRAFT_807895 [Mycena albidolilacea]|uniref:Uncharacterized protein n=1 Tax=Mycena albidolilacea TaxID=1033008 RepID=A0AAD7ESL5_9AGAR|nr:hypothetical protein DFH08DRAFT_807895 [Mycena albidolilacea]